MAHHRRKRPHGKPERSSDWVYPQIEKGRGKRSRYAVARWVAKVNDQLKQFKEGITW